MTPELIETFKRAVMEGKRGRLDGSRTYRLDLGREEIISAFYVHMPRREGGIIALTEHYERGCRGWELSPDSPEYSAFIALSSMRESRKA